MDVIGSRGEVRAVTVGVEPCQADLFKGSAFVRERLGAESVFAVLEREGRRLFPDAMFDDLFSSRGGAACRRGWWRA